MILFLSRGVPFARPVNASLPGNPPLQSKSCGALGGRNVSLCGGAGHGLARNSNFRTRRGDLHHAARQVPDRHAV
jgi:hypothetical protein